MKVLGEGLSTFTHWFAWTLSVIASTFFIYYLIGDTIPDLIKGKNINELFFLPFLLMAIIGSFLSFFRLKAGAILMLIGGIGMVVNLYLKSGMNDFGMMVVYGLPYILPAFLFIVVRK
jgi:hypothetical protein